LKGFTFDRDEQRLAIPNLNYNMAFAELVTHLAFLRTVPAPVFNSEINLNLSLSGLGGEEAVDIINLTENQFNVLPHKNQEAIKILIECLDF
jgi:hypothetical protein